jgi:uncharacterized protein (DUF433 family)
MIGGDKLMIATLPQILLDDRGIAWIEGTNTKVKEVVLDKLAYGWSPEEIHRQHPDLPMAKIHAALAFYYDHQNEMDAEMEEDYRRLRELRDKTPPSPFVQRMRGTGKIPFSLLMTCR